MAHGHSHKKDSHAHNAGNTPRKTTINQKQYHANIETDVTEHLCNTGRTNADANHHDHAHKHVNSDQTAIDIVVEPSNHDAFMTPSNSENMKIPKKKKKKQGSMYRFRVERVEMMFKYVDYL